jgi:hypothetical protein
MLTVFGAAPELGAKKGSTTTVPTWPACTITVTWADTDPICAWT